MPLQIAVFVAKTRLYPYSDRLFLAHHSSTSYYFHCHHFHVIHHSLLASYTHVHIMYINMFVCSIAYSTQFLYTLVDILSSLIVSIHTNNNVTHFIENACHLVRYLPSCAPDNNPIQLTFGVPKSCIKRNLM